MKKSCSRCGRIHDKGFDCRAKRTYDRNKKKSEAAKFRSTMIWTRLSIRIRERDLYICQACLHGLGSKIKFTINEPVEVHHIEDLENNFELRDDEENLITLCKLHHEEAEAGEIESETLHKIAKENNEKYF